MNGEFPLSAIPLGVLRVSLVAIAFAAAATWLVQRSRLRRLVPLWLGASVLSTGVVVFRLSRLAAGPDLPAMFHAPFPVFWLYLPFWVFGFGAISLYVGRRVRRGRVGFSVGVAVQCAGLFWAGALLFIVLFAVVDLKRLF